MINWIIVILWIQYAGINVFHLIEGGFSCSLVALSLSLCIMWDTHQVTHLNTDDLDYIRTEEGGATQKGGQQK